MKRTLLSLLCFALALLLMGYGLSVCWAAGTVSETEPQALHDNLRMVTLRWTAGADSNFTAYDMRYQINGRILAVITRPDTSKGGYAVDNFDITLNSPDSLDVMGGALSNRDQLNTERAIPWAINAADSTVMAEGVPTHGLHRLKITNIKGEGNIGAYISGLVRIYYEIVR